MILIKFKNLDRSEIAIEAAEERLDVLVEKFPDLKESKLQVTFEMENSPFQAGPDLFKVKIHVATGRYKGVTIEKGSASLYVALADVIDHMLELLNRFGDKARVKERRRAREIASEVLQENDQLRHG